MIAAVSSPQQSSVLRDTGHRSSQSVPPISPSSPTFRHSTSSSISQLPLTPDSSPRYRPKYGKRLMETSHKVTSPLISKDENEPPASPSSPTYKHSVTFPLSRSEEKENLNQRESFPSIPSTFPLSSPPASPPLSKRKMRPSLEGVFDTPSPKPRDSSVLTPPATEQQQRPLSNYTRDRARQVARGENPFIFGKSTPRRSTRSEPESPTTSGTELTVQAPAVSVTSPTPRPSPSKISGSFPPVSPPPIPSMSSAGNLKLPHSDHGHGPTKTVTYEDEVLSGTSIGRIKSKDEFVDNDGKMDSYSSGGSKRVSNATGSSIPPSAFSRRNSKSKSEPLPGRISPANVTPEGTGAASNRLPGVTTPRPTSRVGSRSVLFDANSSRTSIPISAIVNPRPASVRVQTYDFIRRDEGLYMRDPYRETKHVSWKVHIRGQQLESLPDLESGVSSHHSHSHPQLKTPLNGLLFYPGFLFPPLWWIASFLKWSYFDPQVASEKRWSPWRVQLARDQDSTAKAWRDRCRFMALLSLVTYLPLIVLLAIFIPK